MLLTDILNRNIQKRAPNVKRNRPAINVGVLLPQFAGVWSRKFNYRTT